MIRSQSFLIFRLKRRKYTLNKFLYKIPAGSKSKSSDKFYNLSELFDNRYRTLQIRQSLNNDANYYI